MCGPSSYLPLPQAATKKQKYEKICEKKMSTPVEVLCRVGVVCAEGGEGMCVIVRDSDALGWPVLDSVESYAYTCACMMCVCCHSIHTPR